MATTYTLAMERTDGTMDPPFFTMTNKARAIACARKIAKSPAFDCTKIWVDRMPDAVGVFSAALPKWEG